MWVWSGSNPGCRKPWTIEARRRRTSGRAGAPWQGLAKMALEDAALWSVEEPQVIAELASGELRLSAGEDGLRTSASPSRTSLSISRGQQRDSV